MGSKPNAEKRSKIIEQLKSGTFSVHQIAKQNKCKEDTIIAIAKSVEFDLESIFYKRKPDHKCGLFQKEKGNINYELYKKEYESMILSMVYSGATPKDIYSKTNRGQCFFESFMRRYDTDGFLDKKLKENIKQRRNALCLINSLKVQKENLYARKATSEAMVLKFLELKNKGDHAALIKKELKKLGCGHGIYVSLCEKYGKPNRAIQSGKNNGMFGKSPGSTAGRGANGWVFVDGEKFHFRSSLELKIFLTLEHSKIKFTNCAHRIPYTLNGIDRTYSPDFCVGDTVYEIKPTKLLSTEENEVKFKTARAFLQNLHLNFDIKTEKDIDTNLINKKFIFECVENNKIIATPTNLEKIIKWIK